jgi:transcriptional regulator GlxA family with amidase domain
LEETQMCLADVASATGFASTSTLSKAFRDVYNESPNEMRMRNKIQILDYCVDSSLA